MKIFITIGLIILLSSIAVAGPFGRRNNYQTVQPATVQPATVQPATVQPATVQPAPVESPKPVEPPNPTQPIQASPPPPPLPKPVEPPNPTQPVQASPPPPKPVADESRKLTIEQYEERCVIAINHYRNANGLQPIEVSSKWQLYARQRAHDMCIAGRTGRTIKSTSLAENHIVSVYNPTDATVDTHHELKPTFDLCMQNEECRNNILHPNCIRAAASAFGDEGTAPVYMCLVFEFAPVAAVAAIKQPQTPATPVQQAPTVSQPPLSQPPPFKPEITQKPVVPTQNPSKDLIPEAQVAPKQSKTDYGDFDFQSKFRLEPKTTKPLSPSQPKVVVKPDYSDFDFRTTPTQSTQPIIQSNEPQPKKSALDD